MVAKKVKSPSIAQIEKSIARVAAELQRARKQKVTDAKKSLAQVRVAVTEAAAKVKQLTAAGATTAAAKKKLQKAEADLSQREQAVTLAQDNFAQAQLALEIAVASAAEAAQVSTAARVPAKAAKASLPVQTSVKGDAKKTASRTAATQVTTASAKTGKAKTGAATKRAEKAPASVAIKVTEKKVEQVKRPKKNVRTQKAPLAKAVASESTNNSVAQSATKGTANTENLTAVQTALAFDEPQAQTSVVEQSRAGALPKPLPVDQDEMGRTTQAARSVTGAEQSTQMLISIIEPRDNPLPKPQPV
jgi:hypothetical protein